MKRALGRENATATIVGTYMDVGKCEFCGSHYPFEAKACPSCGAPISSAIAESDRRKCPACRSDLNPGAYRCPKCRALFCFQCRRPMSFKETLCQCLNKNCQNYGKLLCQICTSHLEKFSTDRIIENIRSSEPLILLGASALGSVAFVLRWQHVYKSGFLMFFITVLKSFFFGSCIAVVAYLIGYVIARHVRRAKKTADSSSEAGKHPNVHHVCSACGEPVRKFL